MAKFDLESFLREVQSVSWFSEIGKPLPPETEAAQILHWEDWPGPDDEDVLEMALWQQGLYDELMTDDDANPTLKSTWEQIHATVFQSATSAVPFDPDKDAWHAPTQAVWDAAWTAGLVGLFLRVGRPVPSQLEEQWSWFQSGHWPCGYTGRTLSSNGPQLLVY